MREYWLFRGFQLYERSVHLGRRTIHLLVNSKDSKNRHLHNNTLAKATIIGFVFGTNTVLAVIFIFSFSPQ
jgi:hypothetical protein